VFHYPAKLRPASAAARVEIAFSFDTTGSMSHHIATVKRELEKIVTQLTGDVPDLRIGVIAHGDYCDAANYVLKRLDLSNDTNELVTFMHGVTNTSGGDGDECYELVLQQAQGFSWTPGSTRVLVVIGDAAPHRPTQYHHINWHDELEVLKRNDVRIYGIKCGGEVDFYRTIAEATNGKLLELANINGITPLMMELCYREAAYAHMETNEDHARQLEAAAAANVPVMHAPAGDLAFTAQEKQEHLAVHRAIHAHDASVTLSDGSVHPISFGNFGCRFVKIGDLTYIEQNKEEGSRYAQMANEGKFITWMVRNGRWGCIMNDTITADEPEIRPL